MKLSIYLLVIGVSLCGLAIGNPIEEDSTQQNSQIVEQTVSDDNDFKENVEFVEEKVKENVEAVEDKVEDSAEAVEAKVKEHVTKVIEHFKNSNFDESKAVEIPCSTDKDCGNGLCKEFADSDSICQCNTGFVSFGGSACSYEQKNKVTAFLLSLFLGNFGADWFYLARENSNYNWAGFFKLFTGIFVVVGGCFMCCAQMCFDKLKEGNVGMVVRLLFSGTTTICSLVNMIWYFVDWIRILLDSFPDGNHVPLKPW